MRYLIILLVFVLVQPVYAEKYRADVYFEDGRQCVHCKIKTDDAGNIACIWKGIVNKTVYFDIQRDKDVKFVVDRQTAEERERLKKEHRARVGAALMGYSAAIQSQHIKKQPITTNCFVNGRIINCSSY
jgi:hypothetical protein